MKEVIHSNQSGTIGFRVTLTIWATICIAMAFFIPKFDFGFDGVVLWLFYSAVLLVLIVLGNAFLTYYTRKSIPLMDDE